MAPFSFCQRAVSAESSSLLLGQLGPQRRQPVHATPASDSFSSAISSISSRRTARSTVSISTGRESISIRSRDAASSTRSMALSGRNRAVM